MPARPQQTVIVIDDQTPAPPSVREFAGKKAHLFYFQSPKNGRRFIFCGQLNFYLAILLKGELGVVGYGPRTTADTPGFTAQLRDGRSKDYETRYLLDGLRPPLIASLTGTGAADTTRTAQPMLITDHYVRDRQVPIENWIFLCASMNRARLHSCENEAGVMCSMLERLGSVSFETLLSQSGIDRACMLAAIARAIQAGAVSCETQDAPITRLSTVSTLRSQK
ncbi:hypothetical protein GTP58_08410 [Duganella sp. CY15W]|uniref:hypothetical protein n=1 Tax=Duganella sp. CY15W TaxID=2692172 RepID=UPI0013684A5E|nr:hypothetical protein [Duganella sp. CY15W]MYM28344.1 hypothetical protein [Duganella sp. CY15W]